jgi:hypothetical protein
MINTRTTQTPSRVLQRMNKSKRYANYNYNTTTTIVIIIHLIASKLFILLRTLRIS